MEQTRPVRPGKWLTGYLGIGPVCVATGYRDAFWARRFFTRSDARAAEDTMEWGRRYRVAWLRENVNAVDPDRLDIYRNASAALDKERSPSEGAKEEERDQWLQLMRTFDWGLVSHWGPGDPVINDKMERLQLLFLVTRLVEIIRGPHSAFAYLMGTDPLIGGAPLLGIRLGGRPAAREVLGSAYAYLAEAGPKVDLEIGSNQ
jgi:hypothetical protein